MLFLTIFAIVFIWNSNLCEFLIFFSFSVLRPPKKQTIKRIFCDTHLYQNVCVWQIMCVNFAYQKNVFKWWSKFSSASSSCEWIFYAKNAACCWRFSSTLFLRCRGSLSKKIRFTSLQSLLVLIALHINFVLVQKVSEIESQELIDSKKMFLKFWMIFAKSLSFVYDEFFHIRNFLFAAAAAFFFSTSEKGQNEKFFFRNFSLDAKKGF